MAEISSGDSRIVVNGMNGMASLRVAHRRGEVTVYLTQAELLRLVDALLFCLYTEADQADMLSRGVKEGTQEGI